MDRSLHDSGASEIVVGEFYSFPPGKLYNKKGIFGYNDYKMYIQLNYTIFYRIWMETRSLHGIPNSI